MRRDPGVTVYRSLMYVLAFFPAVYGMCTGAAWTLIPVGLGLLGLYAVRHPA